MTKIHLHYYALLREQSGLHEETVESAAKTVLELYQELRKRHKFSLAESSLRVAVNDQFADWTTVLKDNDHVIFIPPVAGG